MIGIKFSFNGIKGHLKLPEDFPLFIKNLTTFARWILFTKGMKCWYIFMCTFHRCMHFFSVPVGHLQCLTSAWGRGQILPCRQSSYIITLWHFIGKKKPCTKQRTFISTLAANQEKRERELENRRFTAIEKQVSARGS